MSVVTPSLAIMIAPPVIAAIPAAPGAAIVAQAAGEARDQSGDEDDRSALVPD
jgi:hypothetical protein